MKIFLTPKLFVFLIIWMMYLIIIGTIAQKNMSLFAVQEKYFSSFIIWYWYIPLPGLRLSMILMFFNLLGFFISKNLWKIKKAGIILMHLGVMMLLIGGGLTGVFSKEGSMMIEEGKSTNYIEDYNLSELAVVNISSQSYDVFTIFGHSMLKSNAKLESENINFTIEIENYMKNSEVIPREKSDNKNLKGMMKNLIIQEITPLKEEHLNIPGITFYIKNTNTESDGYYGVFLSQSVPQSIRINDQEYIIILRKERTYLPFSIELFDFKKIMHPGTNIARSYSSEVYLNDNEISRTTLIQMNEPLRYKGYTLYQSSFIEGEINDISVLAVVKNYGRLFPYISSCIICLGLLIHLLTKLPVLFTKKGV